VKFRIALIQMNSRGDKEDNLGRALAMVKEAGREGADLVCLPECFSYLGPQEDTPRHAEEIPGPTTERLAQVAREYGMYVHGGSIPETSGAEGTVYNTTAFLDRDGSLLETYRKIHLFDVDLGVASYRESKVTLPGDRLVTVTTKLGTIGLTICYDLRFPELYRSLALAGARLILVPAAFTLYTGKDHWEPLLRARAIENQVFIAAPAQFGASEPGNMTYGNSMVVDPWGVPVARCSEREQALMVTIDLDIVDEVRAKVPSWDHRVPAIYDLG
jgi:predicted amidohydrolase